MESQRQQHAADSVDQFREELAQGWRRLPNKTAFFVLLAAWVGLFLFFGNSTLGYTDTHSLFGWMEYAYSMSSDDAHGRLIPLVVLVLFWWKRKELLALPKQPWAPGIGLFAVALLIHIFGYMIQQTRISIVGFFLGIYALTGMIWGWRWLRDSFFPFCLFVFCVPLGTLTETISFPLRMLAVKITTALCHVVLGINVIQDGTRIFAPNGGYQYDVAAACSGLRSLTVTFAIAIIYAFVYLRSPWRRLLIIASAFPVAVAANVVRLNSIILAAQTFGKAAGNYVHESTGMSILPLRGGVRGHYGAGVLAAGEQRPTVSGGLGRNGARRMSRQVKLSLFTALSIMTVAAVFLGRLQSFQTMGQPGVRVVAEPVYDPEGNVAGTNRVDLPERVLDFESQELPVEHIVLNWLPKDTTYGQRLYRDERGFEAALNVVLMGRDRTSIHKPQYCLTGAGWRIQKTEKTAISIRKPRAYSLPVMKLTLARQFPKLDGTSELRHGLYVYWFVADDELSADHLQRMWWMARDMIRLGIWQRWAYVACFSVCRPGQEDATYERMKQLITAAVPKFQLAAGTPTTVARRP